jgi:2,5-dihydroxypyridine 5,6-dioxygenase
MQDTTYAVGLFEQELRLCGVDGDQTVAVLSQTPDHEFYAKAFLAAAQRLGAQCFQIALPPTRSAGSGGWDVGVTPLAGNRPAIEALKQADLVIDLVFLLFSAEQQEIQDSGTRVLLVLEPLDVLGRLLPTADLRRRVEVGAELLSAAETLRFTNAAGTDVTYQLGTYPVITEYGYTDTSGRWDHWPSGFLFTGGRDDGVDGTVVLAPGDIIYPFDTYVRDPVTLTVQSGRITDFQGGVEAELLRDYMQGYDDDQAYAISHIGWGLNEKARWSALAADGRGIGMQGRGYIGNVLFSTGPNQELGGTNGTACHLDIPMRNCTLHLDDEPIVVDGRVVVDAMDSPWTGA